MSANVDILDRLIEQSDWYNDGHGPIHAQAAAEIERLRSKVASEREECAKIAENHASVADDTSWEGGWLVAKVAAAIRARGTP